MKQVSSTLVSLALLLSACGGTGDSGPEPTPAATADINLLFMGNSHTAANNLTSMVGDMVRAVRSAETVAVVRAPGSMFLDERSGDPSTIGLLRSQDWSFVVFQAQKYSSSGRFEYSTAEAVELVSMARQQNALPILFPEWPRRNIRETQRIYTVHVSIAQQEAACIAPIGQAWDLALSRHPELVLHADDGNHSAPAGAFLAALILYATITEASPLELPTLTQFSVDAETQALLRAVADETIQTWPPRAWCPEIAGR